MSGIDSEFVMRLVAATQDIKLQDRAAARLAKLSDRACRTLDAVAGGSLFDTEPARFEGAMARVARDDDD